MNVLDDPHFLKVLRKYSYSITRSFPELNFHPDDLFQDACLQLAKTQVVFNSSPLAYMKVVMFRILVDETRRRKRENSILESHNIIAFSENYTQVKGSLTYAEVQLDLIRQNFANRKDDDVVQLLDYIIYNIDAGDAVFESRDHYFVVNIQEISWRLQLPYDRIALAVRRLKRAVDKHVGETRRSAINNRLNRFMRVQGNKPNFTEIRNIIKDDNTLRVLECIENIMNGDLMMGEEAEPIEFVSRKVKLKEHIVDKALKRIRKAIDKYDKIEQIRQFATVGRR